MKETGQNLIIHIVWDLDVGLSAADGSYRASLQNYALIINILFLLLVIMSPCMSFNFSKVERFVL